MLDTLRLDFVTAAKARGLKESTVTYGYALRNAFLPVLTMMGLQFAMLLGGAVLTENHLLLARARKIPCEPHKTFETTLPSKEP
jgi:ABC-type antimicrobial peptide transport system permease subunit